MYLDLNKRRVCGDALLLLSVCQSCAWTFGACRSGGEVGGMCMDNVRLSFAFNEDSLANDMVDAAALKQSAAEAQDAGVEQATRVQTRT